MVCEITSALIIGGAGGLGAAISRELLAGGAKRVIIADRNEPESLPEGAEFVRINLLCDPVSVLAPYVDEVDGLVITAGIGRVTWAQELTDAEIRNSIKVNAMAPIEALRLFYPRINSDKPFGCAVVTSIAGMIASPMYSIYSATKSALSRYIEAVNGELDVQGRANRILQVAPGFIKGTRFHGEAEDQPDETASLAREIVERMEAGDELFIPDYEETYKGVIDRYHADPQRFARESAQYKIDGGKVEPEPRVCVGYITGCFDLFHIGHLNIIKRARALCDWLVVGVHTDASHKGKELAISLEERMAIVGALSYVDEVIECSSEDIDDYDRVRFNRLFVGDDYKGTERFERFERILGPKGVEIVYLPYTKGTSSTMLRSFIQGS